MNTRIKKIVLILPLILLVLLFNYLGTGSSIAETKEEYVEESYIIGETCNIPSTTINVNGKDYDTSIILVYPSGKAMSISNRSVVLEEAGKYTIKYYCTIDDSYYEKTQEFYVKERTFSSTGKKTSYEYGIHEIYAQDKSGIVASIAQNEELKCNQIINLNDYTDEPVIRFFATPSSLGSEDAKSFIITFTDIYDPTNYVDIELKRVNYFGEWAENTVYVTANANGQDKVGLESRDQYKNGYVIVDGSVYSRHKNSEYGSPISFSLSGYLKNGEHIGDREYELYWDYANRKVYSGNLSVKRLISDLDSPQCYSTLWDGFTTGEVFVSFKADNYNNNSIGVVITKVGDINLGVTNFTVDTTPIITIDYENLDKDNLPNALLNKKYKIFKAKSWDFYEGEIYVNTAVYYNYYGNGAYRINVENGYFIPNRLGLYTIEYTSINKHGEEEKVLVDINCINNDNKLSLEVVKMAASGVAGKPIKILDDYSLNNVNGVGSIKITATLKANHDIKYEVSNETLTFTPYYAGVYDIDFEISDYTSSIISTYELEISKNDTPYIEMNYGLPEVLIIGNTYKFPMDVYGYDIRTGEPTIFETEVKVNDGTNEIVLNQNGYYKVSDTDSISLTYYAKNNVNNAKLTFVIPTISVLKNNGNIDIDKYFSKDDDSAVIAADSENVKFSFSKDTEFTFINPLRSDLFETKLVLLSSNFNQLNLNLFDIKYQRMVKISLIKDGTVTKLYINDKYVSIFNKNFSDFISESLMFKYDNGLISFGEIASASIETYLNGEEFKGFNDTLLFSIDFKDVFDLSIIGLESINNQKLKKLNNDVMDPQLILNRSLGEKPKGSQVVLFGSTAYDVLTGLSKVTFTVKGPDKSFITANDGIVLDGTQTSDIDYYITLSEYGKYVLQYTIVDNYENEVIFSYAITCSDLVAPVVTLEKTSVVVKKGSTVEIPSPVISDDITESSKLKVNKTILTPDGRLLMLTSNQIVLNSLGEYIVFYNVFDEAGNISQATYRIIVKE